MAFASLAVRGNAKVHPRAEFNACGETSSTSTTYTGVAARRLCELPRMDVATKSAILGVAAAGAVKQKAVQKDCEERGPCEHAETLDLSPVPKRLLSPPSSWQAQDSGSDIEDAIVNFELEKLLAAELDKLLVPESAPAPEPAPDGSVLHTPPRARSRSPRRATESGSKSSHQ